jgi:spore germination cell wall hydrolase CwlJ-like protein
MRYTLTFLLALFVIPLLLACLTACSEYEDIEYVDLPMLETTIDILETQPTETEPVCTTAPDTHSIPSITKPILPAVDMIIDEPVIVIDPYERELLACVIYQESGGDRSCDLCRRRVADIVLNRVADPRFPDTIYDVLMEESQYGLYHWTGVVWPERAKNPYEQHAVERAYRIAEEVLSGIHSDLYGEGYIWQATFKQGKDNIYHCGHYYGR